jgi:hypothetical protein
MNATYLASKRRGAIFRDRAELWGSGGLALIDADLARAKESWRLVLDQIFTPLLFSLR